MAMNGDTLGSAIAAAIGAVDAPTVANWKLIAGAIVDHIKNNAAVSTNVNVTVSTTGTAAAQTGTGTGTGTGTVA